MKKILIGLIFIVAASQAKAQTNPFPTVDSLIRFINKYIRNSAVDAFTNLRLNTAMQGVVRFSDSALNFATRGVDTIYRAPGKDSIIFKINGVRYAVKDSSGGGGSTNTSIGSGYKIAVNGTNNIKSIVAGWGMKFDSTGTTLTLSIDTAADKVPTISRVRDSMYSVLNNIPMESRMEFIQSGTSATYQNDTLIGKQIIDCSLEGYRLGFITRLTAYMSFNALTGTITLTNASFTDDDHVVILYRTTPIYLADGSGNYLKNPDGSYIILN